VLRRSATSEAIHALRQTGDAPLRQVALRHATCQQIMGNQYEIMGNLMKSWEMFTQNSWDLSGFSRE
jgi:hypothetical protein